MYPLWYRMNALAGVVSALSLLAGVGVLLLSVRPLAVLLAIVGVVTGAYWLATKGFCAALDNREHAAYLKRGSAKRRMKARR